MSDKILVTGASGFIGKHLVKKLSSNSIDYIGLSSKDGDITNFKTLEKFNGKGVTHVIHLAGKTFVPDSWKNAHEFINANFLGTQNVLDFCVKSNCSLTYVSAYIYGVPTLQPINEKAEVKPNNPYAQSKYLAEQLCQFYGNFKGVKSLIFRPFNVYGVGQAEHFLIPEIIYKTFHKNPIEIKDLKPKRDYIYIDDVVEVLVLSIKKVHQLNGEIFNLGTGKSYSVKQVVDMVQKICNTQKQVEEKGVVRENEIPDTIADCKKAEQLLHWKPKWSLEKGLKEIIKSYSL